LYANSGSVRMTEIDRVLAAVNGKIITESDVKAARDLNALLVFGQGSNRTGLSVSDELSRIVDLELIRQELENFPLASEDQTKMESQIQELRQGYAEIGGLEIIMERLGLQEGELLSYLRVRASTLRFVDMRFRPFAGVSEAEVQTYYQEELAPPLKKAGAPVPLLAEVSEQISRLLTEQKVNATLEKWIQEMRSHARIELFPREGKSTAGSGPSGDGSPSAPGRTQP
jgi:hypothetical protein